MISLGTHDGISLRFTGGMITAVDLGRYRRTFSLHEELTPMPEPPGDPLPYLPLEASLELAEARYHGLNPYSGRQLHQGLADGQRTISILQGQSTSTSGLPEVMLARVQMEIKTNTPAIWRLHVGEDAVWESDESGAEVYLGKGCAVRVSATSALAIEGDHTLQVELPVGSSTVEMWIEGQPPLRLAPAVIICTPFQAREAAIVASAVGSPDREYIPILDLDLPPASSQAIQADNARLQEIAAQLDKIEQQMQSVAAQGAAQAPSGIILPGAQAVEQSLEDLERQRDQLLADLQPVQQRVVAYATWSRRSAVVGNLVASLTAGSRESVHLFLLSPYPVNLLADWAVSAEMTMLHPASAMDRIKDWQAAAQREIAPEQLEIVPWHDVQELAGHVWQRVGRAGQPSFFAIPDEPPFYPVGLLDALRRGRALLPRGRASAQLNLDHIQDNLNAGNTSDHAVIVESDGTTAALIGALYAYHSGARFYVNPMPRVDLVFNQMHAITENYQKEQLATLAANAYRYIGEHRKEFMQSQTADPQLKQVAASLSILELPSAIPTPYSDAMFIQQLTTYLTAQQAGAVQGYRYEESARAKDMAQLEAHVTAGISGYVRQAVADVPRITAFTGGLPYGLATDWQGKCVGLVLRDLAAPFILRTVARASVARPPLSLNLVIDPGIQQRPAPDVPELVDRTITLRGHDATLGNVAVLAGLLPIDAVLLHTQGNLDSIILGDARNRLLEVHATEIGSQVHLPSGPLIIYNVPLAWLGLGVTLLEQGAGGFLGTMWPVANSDGDDVARAVLAASVIKGHNPADVLRNLPTFDPRTGRAFVYLGTAAPWTEPTPDPVAGVPSLYGVAARLAATGRVEMATMIYDRLRALTGEIALGNPTLRAELLLIDADFQARLAGRRRERPTQEAIDKIWQSLDTLEKMSLPEAHKKNLQVAVWERTAALEMAAENYERAGELLQAVCDARRGAGQVAGEISAMYLLAQVQERQRQWAAARQTLLDLQTNLANVGNRLGLARVAMSLAYVSLPLAMYPDVLSHVRLAIETSLTLGVQILSEILLDTMTVTKAMTQAGATEDVIALAHSLSEMIKNDQRLAENDRAAIAGAFALIEETARVLQSGLTDEEREAKLASLVEKAQASDFTRTLGLDAWILGAGAPPSGAEPKEEVAK